jgi:hypothetical protein
MARIDLLNVSKTLKDVDGNLLTGDQVWLTFKRYHAFDNVSGMRLRSYPETP